MLLRRHKQNRLAKAPEPEKQIDANPCLEKPVDDGAREDNSAQNTASPEDIPEPEENHSDDETKTAEQSHSDEVVTPEEEEKTEDIPEPEENKKAGEKSGTAGNGKGKA